MNEAPAPRKSWPRRHKILTGLGITLVVIIGASVAAAAGGSKPKQVTTAAANCPQGWVKVGTGGACAPGPQDKSASAQPAPAPSPNGTYSGSCDVSLSSSITGQNYLTGEIDVHNTGNIGTVNRVRISWPLQGFAPIVKSKTVRVRAGVTRRVEFRAAVDESQVGQFQDEQLSSNSGDPCHYHAVEINTFGAVQS